MPRLVICARLEKAAQKETVKNNNNHISALVLRHVTLDAAVTAALLHLIESKDDDNHCWESISFDRCRDSGGVANNNNNNNLSRILSAMLTPTRGVSVKKLVLIQPLHSALAMVGKKLHETTHHLETLKIQGEISTHDAEVLAEGVAANSTLTCLDCSQCFFDKNDNDSFMILMAGISRHQRLRTLRLEACFLEDEQLEQLFRHDRLPTSIQEIYLGVNFLQSRGTRALATLLQNTHHSLQKLDMSRQDVWDDRSYVHLLIDALEVNTTLISLDISSNFLDDSHLRLLANALVKNRTLQELNMGGNSFHTSLEGILFFAERLPFMNGLRCLRMTNTRLTNNQLESLAQGLKGNVTLQTLVLDHHHHNTSEQHHHHHHHHHHAQTLITLYLTLNRGGRILKRSTNNYFPRGLWSLVLARTTRTTLVVSDEKATDDPSISAADVIYDLLHGPILLER